MKWLTFTVLADLVATSMVRLSKGFTVTVYTVLTVVAYIAVFATYGKAVEGVPLGTAYAIWSGLGTAGVATIGVLAFNDKLKAPAIIGIALVITGIIIMNLGGIRNEH